MTKTLITSSNRLYGRLRRSFLWDWRLWCLVLYALVIRLLYAYDGVIPFTFDHGKDFLAIAHMALTGSPKLIGPWTSIPGLYFGPAWYYLLAPFYALSGFNQVAAVIPLIVLLLAQVVLVKKYFGYVATVMVATAPAWITISVSAWDPFPMTLISWILVITASKVDKLKQVTPSLALLAGMTMSFGFHFSAAFAVFYPLIFLLLGLLRKWKVSFKSLTLVCAGFMIPFLPQLLFEIRHNFVQSRAVIDYFFYPTSAKEGIAIKTLAISFFNEIRLGVSPDLIVPLGSTLFFIFMVLSVALVIKLRVKNDRQLRYLLVQVVVFTTVSIIGLLVTHYNHWYILALLPPWVALFGYALSRAPRAITYIVIIVLLLAPLGHVYRYFVETKSQLLLSRQFLPAKVAAIDTIYAQAENQSFSSFHYVPDIYDFSYQALYLNQYLKGLPLPIEFTYQKNVPDYYQGKNELFASKSQKGILDITTPPSKIFYIVEKPEKPELLREWWSRQQFGTIEKEFVISPELVVFQATSP